MISADWTDLDHGARKVSALRSSGLRDEPAAIVVMETVENRPRDELAVGRFRRGQLRVRVWNPEDALVDASGVEPTGVLSEHGSQLPLVPHQDSVEQFTTQGALEGDAVLAILGMAWPS